VHRLGLLDFAGGGYREGKYAKEVQRFRRSAELGRLLSWMSGGTAVDLAEAAAGSAGRDVSAPGGAAGPMGNQRPRPRGRLASSRTQPEQARWPAQNAGSEPESEPEDDDGATIEAAWRAAARQASRKAHAGEEPSSGAIRRLESGEASNKSRRKAGTGRQPPAAAAPADEPPPVGSPRVDRFRLRAMVGDGSLVGRRVKLFWGGDDTWYGGTVQQCRDGLFQLEYDDGEMSWENIDGQVGVHLLAAPQLVRSVDANPAQPPPGAADFALSFGAKRLRLTWHTPPRIALRDFIACVTGDDAKAVKEEAKAARHSTLKQKAGKHTFGADAVEVAVLAVDALEHLMPLLPRESFSRFHETGDLHRLQQLLRRETAVQTIELRVRDRPDDDGGQQEADVAEGGSPRAPSPVERRQAGRPRLWEKQAAMAETLAPGSADGGHRARPRRRPALLPTHFVPYSLRVFGASYF
jgi:hypothetical protein